MEKSKDENEKPKEASSLLKKVISKKF